MIGLHFEMGDGAVVFQEDVEVGLFVGAWLSVSIIEWLPFLDGYVG